MLSYTVCTPYWSYFSLLYFVLHLYFILFILHTVCTWCCCITYWLYFILFIIHTVVLHHSYSLYFIVHTVNASNCLNMIQFKYLVLFLLHAVYTPCCLYFVLFVPETVYVHCHYKPPNCAVWGCSVGKIHCTSNVYSESVFYYWSIS